MRHTWALQAKQSAHYLSAFRSPAGFVEPVPEFYGRFAELVKATREALDRGGALAPFDSQAMLKEMAGDLKAALEIVARARKMKMGLAALSTEEKELLARFDPRLEDFWNRQAKDEQSEKALASLAFLLEAFQELGKPSTPEDLHLMGVDTSALADKWDELENVCRRLEILAHKQLRQVPLSAKENEFLKGYGKQLARIMLYGGNSYITPRDDSPRIVDVFTNPAAGKHLLVGTARPRYLWVLYPVKGAEVLCRGAVLPYREFEHSQRLTDGAWKTLLDSPQRPALPVWIRPVTAAEEGDKNKETK
jgi:hypothetical protein